MYVCVGGRGGMKVAGGDEFYSFNKLILEEEDKSEGLVD